MTDKITPEYVLAHYSLAQFTREWLAGDWVNSEEAAKIVGRSTTYLRKLVGDGKLSGLRLPFFEGQRGALFFRLEWLDEHFQKPPGWRTLAGATDEGLQAYRAGGKAWQMWVETRLVR